MGTSGEYVTSIPLCISTFIYFAKKRQDTVLSQGVPRDAAVNFGTYRSFQQHRVVFTAITLSN